MIPAGFQHNSRQWARTNAGTLKVNLVGGPQFGDRGVGKLEVGGSGGAHDIAPP